jgi:hypothetical protein
LNLEESIKVVDHVKQPLFHRQNAARSEVTRSWGIGLRVGQLVFHPEAEPIFEN